MKDRDFTDAEVDRLARYQMATIEKVGIVVYELACAQVSVAPSPAPLFGAMAQHFFRAYCYARTDWIICTQWYTPCGSAGPPHQSGPECAVEHKVESLFDRIRSRASALGLPRPTAILYWNSMFDFRSEAECPYLDVQQLGFPVVRSH